MEMLKATYIKLSDLKEKMGNRKKEMEVFACCALQLKDVREKSVNYCHLLNNLWNL